MNQELIKQIKELENKELNNIEIAKILNISISQFYVLKRSLGISKRKTRKYLRKFNINDDYFSTPNKENCYWAGFIAADGCIHNNRKLVISISDVDLILLEDFKKHTNCENNIHFYNPKIGNRQCKISIYSEKICCDLKKHFNIIKNKTLVLKPPNIKNKDYIDYYIKGYIDGDGCISLNKRKGVENLTLHLTGTKDVLNWCNDRFSEILNRKAKSLSKRSKTSVYQTRYEDLSGRKLFLHYENLDYGLIRKWSKEKKEFCLNWKRKC